MATIDEYIPISWANDSAPAIDGANLNYAEQGIKRATDGVNANSVEISNLAAGLPSGMIIMWWGTSVPTGWKLCDGNNGTPDMNGRFAMGRDNGVAATAGGSATSVAPHTHADNFTIVDAGDHDHTVPGMANAPIAASAGSWANSIESGTDTSSDAGAHSHTLNGSVGAASVAVTNGNLPPYRTLMYIMKI